MGSILEFRGKYRWLSNFAQVDVVMDGVTYPSVENAYQAAKTLVLEDRLPFTICSAGGAKRQGKTLTLRKDWMDVCLGIMFDLCRQKYEQEPYRSLLLATGDCLIVEGNCWNDTFWGVCRGTGLNHLGRITMRIREDLIASTDMGRK